MPNLTHENNANLVLHSQAELVANAGALDLKKLYDDVTDQCPGYDPFGRHWLPLPFIQTIIGQGSDVVKIANVVVSHLMKHGAKM